MLGRVVALLVLTVSTVAFAPSAAVDPVEAEALDTLLRTYDYHGMNRQDVLLLLAPEEVHERYYFVMDSESLIGAPPDPLGVGTTEEDTAVAAAWIEVKVQGSSALMCRGPVYSIADGQKHLNCDGLQPATHYVVTYISTLPAEITLWGNNPDIPAGPGGFNPLDLLP